MGLALLPLAWLDPAEHFGWWRVLLLTHGFCAATQDVAIDALAINTVPSDERGRINGYTQAGVLAGRSLFGGGSLLLAGTLGKPGMILALVGAMVGGGLCWVGRLADRYGNVRVVAWSLLWFCLSILALAAADFAGAMPGWARLSLLGLMYVGVGRFTASSYSMFMNLTDARLGGTQFSAFMGATNGCESWLAATGGRIVAGAGYPAAFVALRVASLLTLPLLRWLRRAEKGESGLLRNVG